MTALIEVENLTLQFKTDEGLITAVDNVSFSIDKGEVMGLVGESGSGKSVTAKSLMHLNARNAVYSPESRITLHTDNGPVDVLSLKKPAELEVVRGGAISMIFSHNAQVVANEHEGQAHVALDLFQQVQHIRLNGYIQSCDTFVCNDEIRARHKGPRD